MRLEAISIGKNPPHEVNVVIEVPIGGEPIKYEMDKDAGTLIVDRFLYTAMRYPGNYGFIPHTLSGFTVTRRFRGAVYHITVDNAAGVQHGIKAVTVDGKAISGNVLPLAAAGTEVTVQVTMG